MIAGLGTDLCDIARWEAMAARRPGVVAKLLTPAEAALPAESQAARFAAKEALIKALGGKAFPWHDAEITPAASGAPELRLTGTALALARASGASRWHVSLSHDGGIAVAFVILEA
jgi:holo-[acyl-carrier protein] synthase